MVYFRQHYKMNSVHRVQGSAQQCWYPDAAGLLVQVTQYD